MNPSTQEIIFNQNNNYNMINFVKFHLFIYLHRNHYILLFVRNIFNVIVKIFHL